jgi:hypothetical protein
MIPRKASALRQRERRVLNHLDFHSIPKAQVSVAYRPVRCCGVYLGLYAQPIFKPVCVASSIDSAQTKSVGVFSRVIQTNILIRVNLNP